MLVSLEGVVSGCRIGGMRPEFIKMGSCIMSLRLFGGVTSLLMVT